MVHLIMLGLLFLTQDTLLLARQKNQHNTQQPAKQKNQKIDSCSLIQKIYKDNSGYGFTDEDKLQHKVDSSDFTYGEMDLRAGKKFINRLNLTEKDIFYDLGSGTGKLCIQMALDSKARVIGVELIPSRHAQAETALKRLQDNHKINLRNRLTFLCRDFLNTSLDDATIIYMASTCFSDELMKSITEKLSYCRKGLRLFTLNRLPANDFFTEEKTHSYKMSWGKHQACYSYILTKSKNL